MMNSSLGIFCKRHPAQECLCYH